MKLKNPNETPGNGGFLFEFKSDSTNSVVPVTGCNSISQLTRKAEVMMRKHATPVPRNLAEIIEHQICLRQGSFAMDVCWAGGIGDKLHHKYIKPFLEASAKRIEGKGRIGKAVASVVRRIKSCGGCSGTRVYDSKKAALGRAGKLNKAGNLLFGKVKHDG